MVVKLYLCLYTRICKTSLCDATKLLLTKCVSCALWPHLPKIYIFCKDLFPTRAINTSLVDLNNL